MTADQINKKIALVDDPHKLTDENHPNLLDNVNWLDPDRVGLQSSAEIRELLRKELEKYFVGEVTQKYILQLVGQLDNDFYDIDEEDYDPEVKGITCKLSEINNPAVRYNIYKTPEEIDVIFRTALEKLKQATKS